MITLLFCLALQDEADIAHARLEQLDRAVVLYAEKHGSFPKALSAVTSILLVDELPSGKAFVYDGSREAYTLEVKHADYGKKITRKIKDVTARKRSDEERRIAMIGG